MAARVESLRERKKRATRESIATAARSLFAKRGFDAVTVAEIAVAADVSEKTVFNHFATKEELAFAGGEAPIARLISDITDRAQGTSVLDVFRASTDAMIEAFANTSEGDEVVVITRIVWGSVSLRDRLPVKWERETAAIAAAISDSVGAEDGDVLPMVAAHTLSGTHRAVFAAAIAGLLDGEDGDALAARLRIEASRAYDQLAGGLGGYGSG